MTGKMALAVKLAGVVAATLSAASALAAVTISKVAEYDIDNLGCGGIVYLGGNNYYLLQDHDDSTKKATLYPATIQVDPSTGKITNNLKSDIATAGKTRLILSDDASLPAKAFYLISVSR